jgi:hypothetical protein
MERSPMDLNYLYYRQQVSSFMADNAACEESRRSHREMADGYRALIDTAKRGFRFMVCE